MSSGSPPILRPTPRRPFDVSVTSATPPESLTPAEPGDPNHLDTGIGGSENFHRTRSILNLTSSTLFGIYSPTAHGEREEPSPPWGTGAETPYGRSSLDGELPSLASRTEQLPTRRGSSQYGPSASLSSQIFNFTLRAVLLFSFGMGYGVLVTHLHNDQRLAPFHVEGIIKPSYNWSYLIFWGVAGIGLGSLLPWVDTIWKDTSAVPQHNTAKERTGTPEIEEDNSIDSGFAAEWNPVVRSIGAFVGIAFAIRKLPWASTLQASLTLALVNPVLWYIIDRSKAGFLLSATVGLVGTTVLLGLNPEMMPSPAPIVYSSTLNSTNSLAGEAFGGFITKQTVECGTWIISVLFCSCLCFGNIGRRLSLKRPPSGKRTQSSFT